MLILMRRQWPLAMAFGNAARAIAHGHGHLSHTAHEDEQPTGTSLSRGEALTPRGSQPEQCGLKWVVLLLRLKVLELVVPRVRLHL